MKRFTYVIAGLMMSLTSFAYDIEDGTAFCDDAYSYVYSSEKSGLSIGALSKEKVYGDIVLPETAVYNNEEIPVVDVRESGFKGSEISSVTISRNIKTISKDAFYSSTVKRVIMDVPGATLESIGYRAFSLCAELVYIDFPKSLRTLESDAIYSSRALPEVILPEGLEQLHSRPADFPAARMVRQFTLCSALRLIVLPSTLKDEVLTICKSQDFNCDRESASYRLVNFSMSPCELAFGYTADVDNPDNSWICYYYCWPGVGYYPESVEYGLQHKGARDIVSFTDVVWGDGFCEFTATPGCEGINIAGITVNGTPLTPVASPVMSRAEGPVPVRYRAEGVSRDEGLNFGCSVNYAGGEVCSHDFILDSNGNVSGIGTPVAPAVAAPERYYDIMGRALQQEPEKGMYIKVAGGKAEKKLR